MEHILIKNNTKKSIQISSQKGSIRLEHTPIRPSWTKTISYPDDYIPFSVKVTVIDEKEEPQKLGVPE